MPYEEKDAGVAFVFCRSTGRILLERRGKHVNNPGSIGLFGGSREDTTESYGETATRELYEETGLNLKPIRVISIGPRTGCAVFIVDEEIKPRRLSKESAGYMWVSELPETSKLHPAMAANVRLYTKLWDRLKDLQTKEAPEISPELKAWFGDSKVVDSAGRMLRMFHGTSYSIREFSHEYIGHGNDEHGPGFYFTSRPDVASSYQNDPTTAATIEVQPWPNNLDKLEHVKDLPGSTGPKLVRDTNGAHYVLKTGRPEIIDNAITADRLYEKAGVPTPSSEPFYGPLGANVTKLTRFVNGVPLGQYLQSAEPEAQQAVRSKLRAHFLVDALLANWDVLGGQLDNVLVGEDGTPYRIDNSGALEYRALGEPREFGDSIDELDSMRCSETNPVCCEMFGDLSADDLRTQYQTIWPDRGTVNRFLNSAPWRVQTTLRARMADLHRRLFSEVTGAIESPNAGPNVMPVYLRIRKPVGAIPLTRVQLLKIISRASDDALTNFGDVDHYGRPKVIRDAVEAFADQDDQKHQILCLGRDLFPGEPGKYLEILTAVTGYDGILVHHPRNTIAVVFHPSQIKSVHNRGSYSKRDNDVIATVEPVSKLENREAFEKLAKSLHAHGEIYVKTRPQFRIDIGSDGHKMTMESSYKGELLHRVEIEMPDSDDHLSKYPRARLEGSHWVVLHAAFKATTSTPISDYAKNLFAAVQDAIPCIQMKSVGHRYVDPSVRGEATATVEPGVRGPFGVKPLHDLKRLKHGRRPVDFNSLIKDALVLEDDENETYYSSAKPRKIPGTHLTYEVEAYDKETSGTWGRINIWGPDNFEAGICKFNGHWDFDPPHDARMRHSAHSIDRADEVLAGYPQDLDVLIQVLVHLSMDETVTATVEPGQGVTTELMHRICNTLCKYDGHQHGGAVFEFTNTSMHPKGFETDWQSSHWDHNGNPGNLRGEIYCDPAGNDVEVTIKMIGKSGEIGEPMRAIFHERDALTFRVTSPASAASKILDHVVRTATKHGMHPENHAVATVEPQDPNTELTGLPTIAGRRYSINVDNSVFVIRGDKTDVTGNYQSQKYELESINGKTRRGGIEITYSVEHKACHVSGFGCLGLDSTFTVTPFTARKLQERIVDLLEHIARNAGFSLLKELQQQCLETRDGYSRASDTHTGKLFKLGYDPKRGLHMNAVAYVDVYDVNRKPKIFLASNNPHEHWNRGKLVEEPWCQRHELVTSRDLGRVFLHGNAGSLNEVLAAFVESYRDDKRAVTGNY